MDFRKKIIQIESEKYTALMTDFMQELATTRLQKLARLPTGDTVRENRIKHLQEQGIFSFSIKTFTAIGPATDWLKAS